MLLVVPHLKGLISYSLTEIQRTEPKEQNHQSTQWQKHGGILTDIGNILRTVFVCTNENN